MSELKGMKIYMATEPQEDESFYIKKSARDGSLAVFDEETNAVRQVKINDDSTELREGLILSSERKKKIERQIERLTTDRQNAISLMSKSWQHDSENQDDLMTRYVTMAENQFKKKDEEIERLTAIATKHATRCDELYEFIEKIANAKIHSAEIDSKYGGTDGITYIDDHFVGMAINLIDKSRTDMQTMKQSLRLVT